MELDSGGFYQHVIYVHLHGCSYLFLEHPIHQPSIGSSCVLESKRHHTITIGSLCCDERGLFLVIWVHANLIIAGEGIHKTEEFMDGSGIYDEVNPRRRETVFWSRSVDVSEVDAESLLVVFFFYKYDVGQPFRIFYLSDCPCLEEFFDLLVDRFFSVSREAPPLLFYRLERWTYVQPMSSYCRVNSSHVCLLPREDFFVLSKKKWVRRLLRSSASLERI